VIAHNVLWLCLALPTCQDAQRQVAPIGGVEYNPHYAKSITVTVTLNPPLIPVTTINFLTQLV
jgi:hypothetical protein